MLYLNENDIRRSVSFEAMMDTIEQSLRIFAKGEYVMADRLAVPGGDTTMLYMPCFAGGYAGTKILASCPDNPRQGLPALSGIVLLNRADNGQILAIMDGATITALRTGAVGGMAIRNLADENAHTVGLAGCGVQGVHQLAYACRVREIEKIYLYDAVQSDLSGFIARLEGMISPMKPEIIVCNSADEMLEKSEIVITATPSKKPLFSNNPELFKGKCIIAIGSWQPDMRELPDAIWQCSDVVYTELPFACEETGDLSQPLESGVLTEDRVKYFGDFLLEKNAGKVHKLGETRFYKSVGMGIYDTMAAQQIYKTALERGFGQELK